MNSEKSFCVESQADMTQPNTAVSSFCHATLPNYATAQMTIINPIPTIRPCQSLPWSNGRVAVPSIGKQSGFVSAFCPQQPSSQVSRPFITTSSQTNQPTSSSSDMFTNQRSCVGPQQNNRTCDRTTTAEPVLINAGKWIKQKQMDTKQAERNTYEDLHETIQRQRKLIGKLISVIVKDKLKDQDTTANSHLQEGDYQEVEKLLKFSHVLNGGNSKYLYKDASNPLSSHHKKRTRTTSEKKLLCKRLRKDKRSPRPSLNNRQPSVTDISLSVVATSQIATSRTSEKSPESKEVSSFCARNDVTEEELSPLRKRVLKLMHPDGDSRLRSLRTEFTRQLDSLEEDFKSDLAALRQKKETLARLNVAKPAIDSRRAESTGDSDWSPYSGGSSCRSNNQSDASYDSAVLSESFSPRVMKTAKAKKKKARFPQKACRRNQKSATPPNFQRQASHAARKKIDKLLHGDSDDTGSRHGGGKKSFPERALEKICHSKLLWNRMSVKTDSKNFQQISDEHREEISSSSLMLRKGLSASSSTSSCAKKVIAERETPSSPRDETDESAGKLPDNETDRSYIMDKFIALLPNADNHEEVRNNVNQIKNEITDKMGLHLKNRGNAFVSPSELSEQIGILQAAKCDRNISPSDIFQPAGNVLIDEAANQSAPGNFSYEDAEIYVPQVISEVVVVTTDSKQDPEIGETVQRPFLELGEKFTPNDPAVLNDIVKTEAQNTIVSEVEHIFPNCFSLVEQPHIDQKVDFSRTDNLVDSSKQLFQRFRPLTANETKALSEAKKKQNSSGIRITSIVSLSPKLADTSSQKKLSSGNSKPNMTRRIETSPGGKTSCSNSAAETNNKVDKTEEDSTTTSHNDVGKSLARPLRNLISDITLDRKSKIEADIVEWSLVQRKAMGIAKQRIQKQLSGTSNDEETAESTPKTPRRLSLRSHSLPTSNGKSSRRKKTASLLRKNRRSNRKKREQTLSGSDYEGSNKSPDFSSSDDDLPLLPWICQRKKSPQ